MAVNEPDARIAPNPFAIPVCGSSAGSGGTSEVVGGTGFSGVFGDGIFGTSTSALSQPSLFPGTVGVSTQAMFFAFIFESVA